jgi:hypothetical protein
MLLLSVEQDITIARTTFYYIQNNFVCHLDKKIKCYNKWEQLSEQDPIIAKISLNVISNKTIVVSEQI